MRRIFRAALLTIPFLALAVVAVAEVVEVKQSAPATIELNIASDIQATIAAKNVVEPEIDDKDLQALLDTKPENWSNVKSLWR